MKSTLDQILYVVATACMFAFPVLVLGLTPWLGEWFLNSDHVSIGSSVFSALRAILVMLGSSAGILSLAFPAFGLTVWGLIYLLGQRRVRVAPGAPRQRPAFADDGPPVSAAGSRTAPPAAPSAMETALARTAKLNTPGRRVRVGHTPTETADSGRLARRSAADRLMAGRDRETPPR